MIVEDHLRTVSTSPPEASVSLSSGTANVDTMNTSSVYPCMAKNSYTPISAMPNHYMMVTPRTYPGKTLVLTKKHRSLWERVWPGCCILLLPRIYVLHSYVGCLPRQKYFRAIYDHARKTDLSKAIGMKKENWGDPPPPKLFFFLEIIKLRFGEKCSHANIVMLP